tara:strand:- start:309 stop:518 length:210 start_codon:yes stop_codon:yes gene_type:complete
MIMFDPDKTYGVVVWDMPVAVVDIEADDYVRNEDGSIKLFNMPNYDYSYICDNVDVNYLEERSEQDDNA